MEWAINVWCVNLDYVNLSINIFLGQACSTSSFSFYVSYMDSLCLLKTGFFVLLFPVYADGLPVIFLRYCCVPFDKYVFFMSPFFYFINQFYKNSVLFGSDICTKRAQNRSCRVWSQNIEEKTWQGTKIFWPNWAPTQHWTNFWTKEELKFDVERISSNGIWGQWEMQNRYQA
jgi:hypothetical protein